tara:strand:- start:610 stop:765 length:156 start_codon:yes stop_codon:yes gene_type:complete
MAKRTKDATPQKIAEVLNSPSAMVENKSVAMKKLIYRQEHTKLRCINADFP